MKGYVFPGQGAQFVGMGKDLYQNFEQAREMFKLADELLNFKLSKIMFEGSEADLRQTKVTQPAIFLHSTILTHLLGDNFKPDMVAGHSLGEFSALVANKTLTFEDGLLLVYKRAMAMQKSCEQEPSTMAAIIGLDDSIVEQTCAEVDGIVVAANYNCPAQLVISGAIPAVEKACEVLKERGAKRALLLQVGGAFHSPLMESARKELSEAIEKTTFKLPSCPIYQNVTATGVTEPEVIKQNLINQLTSPVRWTQTMQKMIADGVTEVVEVGPGKVLQGLFKKIDRKLPSYSAEVIK